MSEKIMIMPTREPDYISDPSFSDVSVWRIWWDEGILVVNGATERACWLKEENGKMYLASVHGYPKSSRRLCDDFQRAYRQWLDVKVIEGILLK